MVIDLWPPIPPEQQRVIAEMGLCLSFVQRTEHLLSQSLGMAFHDAQRITLQSLEAEDKLVQRKTLGQLMAELRKRVEIAPGFDNVLSSFLDDRNRFIHGIAQDPEFDLEDAEGRMRLLSFLNRLVAEAAEVARVLGVTMVEFISAVEASRGVQFQGFSERDRAFMDQVLAAVPELAGTFRRKR